MLRFLASYSNVKAMTPKLIISHLATTSTLLTYDFVFFGGGQDFEQTVVAKDLPRHKETLEKYINSDKPMLCICGGYQLMGSYYKTNSGVTIPGLDILPLHTVFKSDKRMIGDTRYMTEWGEVKAFENHSGQTYFDNKDKLHPLGDMIEGYGNNPQDHVEGLRYRNLSVHTHTAHFLKTLM